MVKTSPSDIDIHIGRKLKLRRAKLGKNLQEIANILDVSFQQIQKYEKGNNKISSSNLLLIANFLQTSVGYFYEGLDCHVGVKASDFQLNENSVDLDPLIDALSDRELVSLIKAYSSIKNAMTRRKMLDLIKTL